MEGWIKLHRKIQDNWLWQEKRKFSKFEAWVSLLLKANHKENKILVGNEIITIQSGSFMTSEVNLSKEWAWSRNTVRKFLLLLKKEKMLTQTCTTKYTIISIENWALYQFNEQQTEQQIEQQIEQQVNIKLNTNKNDNNIKNEKNIIKKEKEKKKKTFDDVFTENNFSELLEMTLRDFIDMRKSIKKPMTTKALELLISNLNKLSSDDKEKIAILNQSIERGWQTVYPLKTIKPLNEVRETKEEKFKREQKESWERWLNKDD